LPRHWMSNYEGKEKEYPLPASFLEHGARASVTYKLALTVRRGTFAVDTRYVTLSLEGSDSFFCQSVHYDSSCSFLPSTVTLIFLVDRIPIDIVYCPGIRPGPFSDMRTAAYKSGSAYLSGPAEDPDGWHSLNPVTVRGEVFSTREMAIECTVSLPFWQFYRSLKT
jgi:hypothetical protein